MDAFHYPLPEDRIAKFPLPQRDQSKLLQYRRGELSDWRFADLPRLLPKNSLLVMNNTKVVPARLIFYKPTGARIELMCLGPAERYATLETLLAERGTARLQAMIGNAKKWKAGQPLTLEHPQGLRLQVEKTSATGGVYEVRLTWQPEHWSLAQVLELLGQTPLPPYLNREPVAEDNLTYQTVYAERAGSVAAPTAGLHFTPSVFLQLTMRGVSVANLTLHVGAGTFKPVDENDPRKHEMHSERIEVSRQTITQLYENLGKIIVVGTTSMRTLESLYWYAVTLMQTPEGLPEVNIPQLMPYQKSNPAELPSPQDALAFLLNRMAQTDAQQVSGQTQLMIMPGYQFKLCNGLITNFHQPRSTLLLLVSAFIGEAWKDVYQHALANGYRFLSYGDSSLLWREGNAPPEGHP